MTSPVLDQLTVDRQQYFYRDGSWTTPAGLCVSTSQGQALTMEFYQRFGRGPCMPVSVGTAPTVPKPRRVKLVAAKPKTAKAGGHKIPARIRASLERRAEGLLR
jgi:hypothetical protein